MNSLVPQQILISGYGEKIEAQHDAILTNLIVSAVVEELVSTQFSPSLLLITKCLDCIWFYLDLNRNFEFHFGESGSSDDICSEIYGGTSAFSEPESRFHL